MHVLTEKNVMRRKNHGKTALPEGVKNRADVDAYTIEGGICYNIRRRKTEPERVVFYLYDSEFCFPMSSGEWSYALRIMEMLNAELFVPMYPLAPEAGCEEVFRHLIPVYKNRCGKCQEEIILMGSGAGGLLALSLAQLIWAEGLPRPNQLVLLTPVLDTEFFDVKERERMEERLKKKNQLAAFQTSMDYLNRYWVKDMAGKVEYTSPIYGDFTDFTEKVTLISGTEDINNGSARLLCDKIQNTGIPVRFFEYTGKDRGFYLNRKDKTSRLLDKTLQDVLLGTKTEIINQYLAEVKRHVQWSKENPELFQDETALRYSSKHPIDIPGYKKDSRFVSITSAARMYAFDEEVKLFLREYPNGTVVYAGCRMDAMFERVDNGRCLWYNLESPGRMTIRTMYLDRREREKNLYRAVDDIRWMDEIECERDQGILFVFRNVFSYLRTEEVGRFMETLYRKFQGCNVLFDCVARKSMGETRRKSHTEYRRTKFAMRTPELGVNDWNPAYSLIRVRQVLDPVKIKKEWPWPLRLRVRMSQRSGGRNVVLIRLGFEKYPTLADKDLWKNRMHR